MFDEMELDPMAIAAGILGGAISIYVMKNTEAGILLKGISFVLTSILCFFVFSYIKNK